MPVTRIKSNQQFTVAADLDFANFKGINLGIPTNPNDVANKAYVDAIKQALDIKDSVRVATTGGETYTISSGAATQIAGTQVDGVSLAIGDRILIKNAPAASGAGAGAGSANTTQPANGIYVVTANTTNLTITRSDDANVSAEVTAGMYTIATEGSTNADNGYVLTTNDTITLNTTALTFTQFSGAGQITAGDGLDKTGNTLSVKLDGSTLSVSSSGIRINASYAGQNTITTVGTITAGTWNGTAVAATFGGTGQTTYTLGDILFSSATNTLSKLAGNTVAAKRFLTQTGTGTVSAAPVWGTILASDIQSAADITRANDTNVTLSLTGGTGAVLSAVVLTLGWNGQLAIGRGGTGGATAVEAFRNISPLTTLGDTLYHNGTDNLRLPGNTTTAKQYLSQTGNGTVSAAPVWSAIAGADVTGADLTTGIADANVTITITTGTAALLRAASITMGWTGQLSVARGGSGRASATAFMPIAGGTTSTGAHQSVATGAATGQPLIYKGASALPAFEALDLSAASVVSNALPVARGGTGINNAAPANGQLLIGNAGTAYTLATLTGSTTIAVTNGPGSIGLAVATGSTGVVIAPNYVVGETPSGTVNGSNATFTLANTPITGTVAVYVNGIRQTSGAGNDYTISSATITFLTGSIPQTGDAVRVDYLK